MEMKKILFIILTISVLSCKAQQVIIPVEKQIEYENDEIEYPDNVYLKDVNNLLDRYVGTWKKTQNNKTYEFYVIKVTRESNNEYIQFKKDELEIRYRITNNTTSDVIVDTTNLNDSPYVIDGKHFNLRKSVYFLDYIGFDTNCGQNGTIVIEVPPTNNFTTMKLFLSVYGEQGDCPGGAVPQILPTEVITLTKQ